jgi:hypothetical protein
MHAGAAISLIQFPLLRRHVAAEKFDLTDS